MDPDMDSDFLGLIENICDDECEDTCDLGSPFDMALDAEMKNPLFETLCDAPAEGLGLLPPYVDFGLSSAPAVDTSSEGGDGSACSDQTSAAPPVPVGRAPAAEPSSAGKRKRPRPPPDDEDARLIALETESHLKKLNIDPDSKEGKVERRKVQNRMSAQMHRERKRAYIESLESEVRQRDASLLRMKLHIRRLEDALRAAGVDQIPAMEEVDLEHATTSESGSDAGYSSSASSSYRGKTGGAPLGLSLFSLLFMMSFGFTLMARPDALGSFLSSGSTAPQASSTALSRADPAEWTGHGRVLLAATSAASFPRSDEILGEEDDTLDDDETDSADVAPFAPSDGLASTKEFSRIVRAALVDTTNSSLWTLDGPGVHLYPRQAREAAMRDARGRGKAGNAATSGALVTTFSAVREPADGPQSSLRGSAGVSSRSRLSEQRALVPSSGRYHGAPETSHASSNIYSSKILMTEGKALLDPSLVQLPKFIDSNTFGFPSSPDEVVRLRHIGSEKSEALAAHALVAPSTFGSIRGRESAYVQSPSPASGSLHSPQFLMMLPLSSVKWGTSWDDDDSVHNPLTQLLKNLHNESSEAGSSDDVSSYWIEIGCSVVKAQLVKNVTLS